MITVCFYGDLASFGRRYKLHVQTPAEALHALFSQIKGLREHIRNGVYQVRFQKADQTEAGIKERFNLPGCGVLHIVPRAEGAGKAGGIIQTVVGVALIAVGVIFEFATAGLSTSLIMAGAGMVLGGISQMLMKPPKMDGIGNESDKGRNTSFSNLDNTAAQGRPLPLAYGIAYCGSRVVSQGVESRRVNGGSETGKAQNSSRFFRLVATGIQKNSRTAQMQAEDLIVRDLTFGIKKTFVQGTAAVAPNGQTYRTDFAADSVRAQNYTADYAG